LIKYAICNSLFSGIFFFSLAVLNAHPIREFIIINSIISIYTFRYFCIEGFIGILLKKIIY